MPKPPLNTEYAQLERDIIDTLLAGLHEWRPDLLYPASHSDMAGCVRALLRMYRVEHRGIALTENDLLLEHRKCRHGNRFPIEAGTEEARIELLCGCAIDGTITERVVKA